MFKIVALLIIAPITGITCGLIIICIGMRMFTGV